MPSYAFFHFSKTSTLSFLVSAYEEAILLNFIYELDKFYEEVKEFLAAYKINSEFLKELISYQKNSITLPGDNMVEQQYSYNFFEFFKKAVENEVISLEKKTEVLRFSSEFQPKDWEEYARFIVWYGRRNKRTLRDVSNCV